MQRHPESAEGSAPPNANPNHGTITTAEAAAYLRCCKSTVRAMVRRGDLPPPFKLGSHFRWDREVFYQAIRDRGETDRAKDLAIRLARD